ncbi:hypothetical protein IFM89_012112 [Coptis chinensis]|uniref:Uncharacterized protein n=1 Tax=Coptis chinensis TaxID=261450 RepID=A0A835I1Q8_9MAGN|nr:hypothetical protein IFM89_012112 [Coptis chinensis]
MRPLEGEEWLKKEGLELQSLQQGPIPPSERSRCTSIGGRNRGGNCPLNGMNFAGHVNVAVVELSAASVTREQTMARSFVKFSTGTYYVLSIGRQWLEQGEVEIDDNIVFCVTA